MSALRLACAGLGMLLGLAAPLRAAEIDDAMNKLAG